MIKKPQIVLDLSMSILNRTAVYSIGEELAKVLVDYDTFFRYWFLFTRKPISFRNGRLSSISGKLFWRIMQKSLDKDEFSSRLWPRRNNLNREIIIFLDPLFAKHTEISNRDIVLIHDIGPISHADYYDEKSSLSYDRSYRRIAKAGSNLVFVSEWTKNQFLSHYPGEYRTTSVIPNFFFSELSGVAPKPIPGISPKFILIVGALERRKNHLLCIDAFRQSNLAKKGYALVLTGPRGNQAQAVLDAIEGDKSILYLGFAEPSVLRWLYQHASALLFPSLLEGFGLPALEAPALGTIPIVSENSVLTEIVGPDGISVDPQSLSSISSALIRIMEMPEEDRQNMLSAINQHQTRYSKANFQRLWTAKIAEAVA
jgi:glycosyltransferase involved in cell wall biosynthesis